MQKVQILNGTPEATFLLTSAATARLLATERYIRSNLITNGDCELDANWANFGTPATNARSSTKVITGDYSRKFTPNAANEGIQSDDFATITERKCYYTLWVYPDDGTIVSIAIRKGDDSGYLYHEIHTGLTQDAWNKIKIEVIELAGGDGAYLVVHSGAQTSGDFYVANIFGSRMAQPGRHSGRRATRMFMTVDADEILWTVGGATPVQSGLGHKVFPVTATNPYGQVVLQSIDAIKTFKYISHDGTNHAKLYVTMEF